MEEEDSINTQKLEGESRTGLFDREFLWVVGKQAFLLGSMLRR
jgi:hypothetical protein